MSSRKLNELLRRIHVSPISEDELAHLDDEGDTGSLTKEKDTELEAMTRLQLEQKDMAIETLKREHQVAIARLEDRVAELLHQRQMSELAAQKTIKAQKTEIDLLKQQFEGTRSEYQKHMMDIQHQRQVVEMRVKHDIEDAAAAQMQVKDLQHQLHMKTLEYERLIVLNEEAQNAVKTHKIEVDMLKHKVEIIRTEYHALQSDSAARIAELETKNATLTERLGAYESVEKELDEAIMNAGVEVSEERQKLSELVSAVPTTLRRRMQHSVNLAKQVLKLQRENAAMSSDLAMFREQAKNAQEELQRTQGLLENTRQPYHYLVQMVMQRDRDLQEQVQLNEMLNQEVKKQQDRSREFEIRAQTLEADLKKLLDQRANVEFVKQMVVKLRREKGATSESVASQPGGSVHSEPNWYKRITQRTGLPVTGTS